MGTMVAENQTRQPDELQLQRLGLFLQFVVLCCFGFVALCHSDESVTGFLQPVSKKNILNMSFLKSRSPQKMTHVQIDNTFQEKMIVQLRLLSHPRL